MPEADGIVVFVGAYDSIAEATEDFEGIKAAKSMHFLGEYESALFEKTAEGDVKILNTDATGRSFGAKAGAVTGAVIGLIFPPSIVGMAAAGAGIGAAAGHFMRGMKRDDIKAIGEMLDEGQAGVIMIGQTTLQEGAERLMKHAAKVLKRQVDADAAELKRAIDEAASV